MSSTVPLEHGKFYHIYNRGVNGCDLFRESINYEHFLRLYDMDNLIFFHRQQHELDNIKDMLID